MKKLENTKFFATEQTRRSKILAAYLLGHLKDMKKERIHQPVEFEMTDVVYSKYRQTKESVKPVEAEQAISHQISPRIEDSNNSNSPQKNTSN